MHERPADDPARLEWPRYQAFASEFARTERIHDRNAHAFRHQHTSERRFDRHRREKVIDRGLRVVIDALRAFARD
jgi:hypothetical protein